MSQNESQKDLIVAQCGAACAFPCAHVCARERHADDVHRDASGFEWVHQVGHEERAAARALALCIGDCADGRPENRPPFVSQVDEDGLCLTCGGDVVLVALGDAEAIMRALSARRCECKPPPRHVETCPQHDPARP